MNGRGLIIFILGALILGGSAAAIMQDVMDDGKDDLTPWSMDGGFSLQLLDDDMNVLWWGELLGGFLLIIGFLGIFMGGGKKESAPTPQRAPQPAGPVPAGAMAGMPQGGGFPAGAPAAAAPSGFPTGAPPAAMPSSLPSAAPMEAAPMAAEPAAAAPEIPAAWGGSPEPAAEEPAAAETPAWDQPAAEAPSTTPSWASDPAAEEAAAEPAAAAEEPAAEPPSAEASCPNCGGATRFIEQYDRHWCDACQQYA